MKRKIRKQVLQSRKSLSSDQILAKSRIIARRFFELPEFRSARTIMCYVSQGSEVNTRQIIKDALQGGWRVAVPVSRREGRKLLPVLIRDPDRELSIGSRGVLEPVPGKGHTIDSFEIDLVVLPGVAFDLQGNRLGRGHAYFDNFLREINPSISKVALAFERQIVDNIPPAHHDIPVNKIITEKRVIECGRAAETQR